MDMRDGSLYSDRELAILAGVPKRKIAEVSTDATQRIVKVTTGPFKGRIYERMLPGLKRRRDLEAVSPRSPGVETPPKAT